MKRTINLRKKIVIKKINLLIFSFILVFIIIILLFKIINERINPILFDYATLESRKFASIIINKAIEKNVATDLVIEDLYIVSKKENNEIENYIKELNILELTPIDAINILNDLKMKVKDNER